jgi:hypothetical protein
MITIEQFQEVMRIKGENWTPLKEEILIVGVINNMSEEQVRNLPIDNYKELKKSITYMDFDPPETLIPEFKCDGLEYKVDTMFRTASQFIDFSELKNDVINNLHLILALFVEGDNKIEMAEKFKQVDYKIAYSVAFFFSRLLKESIESIKIYSKEMEGDGMRRNGDGRQRLMDFLTEIEQNGTSFSKWALRSFLGT